MSAAITCIAPFQGLATSLDTLCAQAYGSGHKHLVGLQFQRMTYFLFLLTVPIAVLWMNAESILRQMVPDAESARLAGLYMKVNIIGMPGIILFEGGKRFTQAQGPFRLRHTCSPLLRHSMPSSCGFSSGNSNLASLVPLLPWSPRRPCCPYAFSCTSDLWTDPSAGAASASAPSLTGGS